jgi:hypothetical protein
MGCEVPYREVLGRELAEAGGLIGYGADSADGSGRVR